MLAPALYQSDNELMTLAPRCDKIPSLTLVNPKSRSKAFIYQAGATFQFRSDMCYILSCGSWFDFFGAFYYIPHLRFGNEFDIGMKAKMGM